MSSRHQAQTPSANSAPQGSATVQIFDGPGRPHRLETLPLPASLAPGEVLVEIGLSTVCLSDLHTVRGRRPQATPCVLGHEAVGRVVATGDGRLGLLPGDRVTWTLVDSCGTCALCTTHRLPQKCLSLFKYGHADPGNGAGLNGCYASHILLRPGTHIVKVPEHLPDSVVAPANCALATAVNAVSQVPDSCQSAVIQGFGLVGLYCCALLSHRGVPLVFCVDRLDHRLEVAGAFGGIAVSGASASYDRGRRRMLELAPGGVDAVLETAGVADVVSEGIRLLRPGGTYVFVGMVHPGTRLDITGEQVIRKCLSIRGVHNYAPEHLEQAVRFLELAAVDAPYDSLVSPPLPLADLDRALQLAETRQWYRVAVQP